MGVGGFNAPTLEALRGLVLAAEAERLEKALAAFEALARREAGGPAESERGNTGGSRAKRSAMTLSFAVRMLLYAAVMRGLPAASLWLFFEDDIMFAALLSLTLQQQTPQPSPLRGPRP